MPEQSHPRVILIDDGGDFRESVVMWFHVWHWAEPVQAGNLADGIVKSLGCEVAVLDLGLPDSQGTDTLVKFVDKVSIPVIVLSANADEGIDHTVMALGADDYLAKMDMDPKVLQKTILCSWERDKRRKLQTRVNEAYRLVEHLAEGLPKTEL